MKLGQVVVCPNCDAKLEGLDESDSLIQKFISVAKPGDRLCCGTCLKRTVEYVPDGVRPATPPWESVLDGGSPEYRDLLLRLYGNEG